MSQHGASENTQVISGGGGAGGRPAAPRPEGAPAGPQRLVVHNNTTTDRAAAEAPPQRVAPPQAPAPAAENGTAVPREPRDRSRVRRARLRTVRVDPWSVMKTAFLLSIAFGIMTVVAVAVLWNVLEAAGVYESVNSTIADVLGSNTEQSFNLYDYIGLRRVLGVASLIAVVDVVLITALATLGSFLYNLSASLLGGIEVTLAEEE